MVCEAARLLIAFGSVIATAGLVIFGIGFAYVDPADWETTLGVILMIGGLVATVAGGVIYRAVDDDAGTRSRR